MPIARWKNLACLACGSDEFVQTCVLRYHPSGGTTQDPLKLRCHACQAEADPQKMLLRLRRAELQAEMAEMELQAETLDASLITASSAASNASPSNPMAAPSTLKNTRS